MQVAIKNGNVDHIIIRSGGHILHVSLDLPYMEPFSIALIFLDCQIAGRSRFQKHDRTGIRRISPERLCKDSPH